MKNVNPLHLIDFYKSSHKFQYPKGTEYVYSNFTPRNSRISDETHIIFFGLQYTLIEYFQNIWNENFFSQPAEKVIEPYKRRMNTSLGEGAITFEHIESLHKLGYLPIRVKALPEGSKVPIGVPVLTIINTLPEFSWLPNYLETLLSCLIWKPCTSATTAFYYRKAFEEFAEKTGADKDFIPIQGHDFSMRGMSGPEDAILSGMGHLTSFIGTDTVPAIDAVEEYYPEMSTQLYELRQEKELVVASQNYARAAELRDQEKLLLQEQEATQDYLVGVSVPATEHSVMSLNTKDSEQDTFERLLTEVHPTGPVSVVSDTWSIWYVIDHYLPNLKKVILNRDGKLVIRPDSGDPVHIICGNPYAEPDSTENKGVVRALWEIFGGTENSKGYKVLNKKIGVIYGDSITRERQLRILSRLQNAGFASSNIVLGIGSFTYEYVTRDTFGFAMKATAGVVNGEWREIYKDPVTGSGKKSAKGLLQVYKDANGEYALKEQCTPQEEEQGELQTVFENGRLIKRWKFSEIRERVQSYL